MSKKHIPEEDAKKALKIGDEKIETSDDKKEENKKADLGLGTVQTEEEKHIQQSKTFAEEANKIGFVDVFPDKLPSEGKYYSADFRFKVKSATFEEIKEYSSMKEEDIYDVDEHVKKIMDANINITRGNKGLGNYKDLSQTDKIFFIFAIRDRTMMVQQREKKIHQNAECPHCGHKNKIEINNDIFDYYKIPKGIMKWYDEMERCFIIKDPVIGEHPLKIYIPTVGVIQHVGDYIKHKTQQQQRGEGGYYNQHELDMASFLISDWRELDTKFERLENIMYQIKNTFNYDRHQTLSKAVDKINYGINPVITVKCGGTGCGKEVSAAARFQGFKSLFDFSNKSDELLSDSE